MRHDASIPALARMAVLTAICIAASVSLFAQGPAEPAENPAAVCTSKNQTDTVTVGQVQFNAYKSSDGACVQAISGGKVIYNQSADSLETYTLGQAGDPQYKIPAIANGTDVTGRGRPDMIVSLFTGGAHCCTIHYLFELDPQLKLLATLNDTNDDLAHFEQLKDGHYYYITADWTFGYWPTCFACSPSEVVTLGWVEANGGGFHLALSQMQTPAPTQAEWNKELAAAQKAVSDGSADTIGTTLWSSILDLIYTGHSDLAWKFLDAAGPKAQQKPFPSLADFCSLLKTDPYWPDLQPTLKDTPPACANAKPQQSQ